jgi:hypothetical protein
MKKNKDFFFIPHPSLKREKAHSMNAEPTRAEIDALHGPVLLEFGAEW